MIVKLHKRGNRVLRSKIFTNRGESRRLIAKTINGLGFWGGVMETVVQGVPDNNSQI